MNTKRGRIIRIVLATVVLELLLYVKKFLVDASYRTQLPANFGKPIILAAIATQVSDAERQSYFITAADNIGRLGIAYYSYGNYAKSDLCYQLAVKKNKSKWRWNYYLGYLNLEQG